MKKILTMGLTLLLGATFAFSGCTSASDGGTVNAKIGIANSADKILQSYDTTSQDGQAFYDKFMGNLKDQFSIKAFRNEYESEQIIITPDKNVKNYTVSVSDFKNGNETLDASLFDIRHEYYHEVESIYDNDSEMLPGMYPDALIPMSVAEDYDLNKIKAGENQGVYISIKIPKDQAVGVYNGTISVNLDGKIQEVSASVEVLDYTLPDTVSMKSCVPVSSHYLMNGELNDTQEIYEAYIDSLKEFRLGAMYLSSYIPGGSRTAQEAAEYDATLAVEAAKDVSVPSYAIRVFEKPSTMFPDGGNVLNEDYFLTYLKAYVDVGMRNNVNLFSKAYVYMGNIIDEPDVGGFWDRANYVSKQFDSVVAQAVTYAKSVKAPQDMIDDLQNLQHIVTGRYSDKLQDVQSFCPTIDILGDSATVEDYKELKESGKDYWWYSCTTPKIPYPTVHIDDNGVSSRLMGWMAKEYGVSGYLTWDCVYYKDYEGVALDVKGMDLYDNVHRWPDAYGDGFFFYPGAVFNMSTPVPSMRLYTIRDGMEDYEALNDLEVKYAAISEKSGTPLSAEGVLNEIYSKLFSSVKVYCGSEEINAAKEILANLLMLADKGVAISDFTVHPDGAITAKIYSEKGDVTLNGQKLTFAGGVSEVSVKDSFVVESEGVVFDLGLSAFKGTAKVKAESVEVYDKEINEQEGAVTDGETGVNAAIPVGGRMDYSLSEFTIDKNTDSIFMGIYLEGDKKVKVSVSVLGRNVSRLIDTVYLHPGDNIVRFDRIGDLDWISLLKGEYLIFVFDNDAPVNLRLTQAGYTA